MCAIILAICERKQPIPVKISIKFAVICDSINSVIQDTTQNPFPLHHLRDPWLYSWKSTRLNSDVGNKTSSNFQRQVLMINGENTWTAGIRWKILYVSVIEMIFWQWSCLNNEFCCLELLLGTAAWNCCLDIELKTTLQKCLCKEAENNFVVCYWITWNHCIFLSRSCLLTNSKSSSLKKNIWTNCLNTSMRNQMCLWRIFSFCNTTEKEEKTPWMTREFFKQRRKVSDERNSLPNEAAFICTIRTNHIWLPGPEQNPTSTADEPDWCIWWDGHLWKQNSHTAW